MENSKKVKEFLVLGLGFSLFVLSLTLSSCGSSSSGDSSSTVTAFPTDLALAAPFATSATKNIAVGKATVTVSSSYADKKASVDSIASGTTTSACTFTNTLFSAVESPTCYGPTMTYTNHPDCPDATSRSNVCTAPNSSGTLPPLDVGIWDETDISTGNACMAAKINDLVENASLHVDTSVNMLATLLCAANVYGRDTSSSSLDMTTDLRNVLSDNGITDITVTSAELQNQGTDSAGYSVYFYHIEGSATDAVSGGTRPVYLYLKHIPRDATNSTYHGKLSYQFSDASPTDAGNCNDPARGTSVTTVAYVGTILYDKSSATSLKYKLQDATYCDSTVNHLNNSTYDISASDKVTSTNLTGWGNDYNYALFDFDPTSYIGTYIYAWQAGPTDGNTRTFNAVISSSGGVKSGTSYFGFGPDIASSDVGDIDGFICNWAGPQPTGNTHNTQLAANPNVQRQCMNENTSTGLYTSVPVTDADTTRALRITYAPTESCNYTATSVTYPNFTYATSAGTMTNDHSTGATAVTNNLTAISAITFGAVTAPTDVYPTP